MNQWLCGCTGCGCNSHYFNMKGDPGEEKPRGIAICLGLLGGCFGLPLLLILAGLSIPCTWVVLLVQFFQERSFQQEMQGKGRFISWNDLVPQLDAGQGTVIIEAQNKRQERFWWAVEDIAGMYPGAMPSSTEVNEARTSYYFIGSTHPFVEWCFSRYLNPDSGMAYLTNTPRSMQRPGFKSAQAFKSKFQEIQVVDTVRKA